MKVILTNNKKIRGLLTKEMLQFKIYSKSLISFVLISIILCILQHMITNSLSLFSFLPIITTIGFGMFSISSFNYDETAKTDLYFRSLPLSSKEIISAKYIFVIFLTIIGTLIGMLLTLFSSTFFPYMVYLDYTDWFLLIWAGLFCVALVEAIQIPLIYKLGAEKARMKIFSIIVILLVFSIFFVGGVFFWLEQSSLTESAFTILGPIVFLCLTALAYYFSYQISYNIHEGKTF